MAVCSSCGEGSIIVDPGTFTRVCDTCGVVLYTDDFVAEIFTGDGERTATLVHSFGDFGHRERRQYHARALFSDVSSRLGLSAHRAADAQRLAADASDGRLPLIPAVAAASSFIAARQHCLPLPISEVADAVSVEPRRIARAASKLSRRLDLPCLPPIDPSLFLSRALHSFSSFSTLDRRKSEEIIGQGMFLIQCATKWFLSTGRQPLPLVAAVASFVAEINSVEASISEIATEIHANVSTSKLRYKEFVDTLVRVARALLPWGEDVNAKNLIHHAPLLIRLMEIKSKSNSKARSQDEIFSLDLDDFLSKNSEEDSKYFNVGTGDESKDNYSRMSSQELERLKLSGISLAHGYKKALEKLGTVGENAVGLGMDLGKKRRLDVKVLLDSWKKRGIWVPNKEITLEQVVERDVGFEALPPSFVAGLESRRMRKMKIEAAKLRINETMNPCFDTSAITTETEESSRRSDWKPLLGKRKRRQGNGEGDAKCIDWEDCLIELLLLHQVNEDEIEQGQYKRLLDLHVF
ncbi:plant-specific TFIIB-related protein PTF2 [Dioscorea cayenensis subsp. rotundata]|uniref:Plant-specific TFIIB-related protein PTF2 n=1 Tax=Dioscorea cayennensis subsp. rotundata TaxID=55577 RepID=A0AB40CCW0_DIOCR|nr:plant-specific TFIIB-related protein PTF2 [Dioscorea cayenensis subsp. rotundata]